VLVLKENVRKPGHFQYTIHYEGKSFSCPRTQKKDLPHISCIFHLFKYVVKIFFSAGHFASHFFSKTLT